MKDSLAVHKLPIDVGDWGIVLRWKVPRDAIIPPLKKGSILTVSLLRATANRGLEVLGVRDERWLNGEVRGYALPPLCEKGLLSQNML